MAVVWQLKSWRAPVAWRCGRELAQDVLKNSAVPEILQLIQRIDAARQGNDGLAGAIGPADLDRELLARHQPALDTAQGHDLVAFQSKRLPGRPLLEHQRHHAHAD